MKLRFLLPLLFCILPGHSHADLYSDRQQAYVNAWVAKGEQESKQYYVRQTEGFHKRLTKLVSAHQGLTSATCAVSTLFCYRGAGYCDSSNKETNVGLDQVVGEISVKSCTITLGDGLACRIVPSWDVDRKPYREALYSECFDSNNRPRKYTTY